MAKRTNVKKKQLNGTQQIGKGLEVARSDVFSSERTFITDATYDGRYLDNAPKTLGKGVKKISPMVSYVDEQVEELKKELNNQLTQLNKDVDSTDNHYTDLYERLSNQNNNIKELREELAGVKYTFYFWVGFVTLLSMATLLTVVLT